jgi:hypothetical protein
VLQSQRGLVGECLSQLHLVGRELAYRARAHLEHAEVSALGAERNHERRAETGPEDAPS